MASVVSFVCERGMLSCFARVAREVHIRNATACIHVVGRFLSWSVFVCNSVQSFFAWSINQYSSCATILLHRRRY